MYVLNKKNWNVQLKGCLSECACLIRSQKGLDQSIEFDKTYKIVIILL